MAKALMDFRVLDIPLSVAFYKWLVDPGSLCADDLRFVDSQLYSSVQSLKDFLRSRRKLLLDAQRLAERKQSTSEVKKELTELAKAVDSLELDFTMPGFPNVELKKNGKDISVSLDNLEEYLNVCFSF